MVLKGWFKWEYLFDMRLVLNAQAQTLALSTRTNPDTVSVVAWTKPSNEYLEEKGYGYEYNDERDAMGREFNEEVHNNLKTNTGLDSKKPYRGIPFRN